MTAFATIADYEAAFNTIVTGDVGLEAQVQWALDAACAEIRSYLSQDLDYVTDDEITLDGTGHQTLLLPQLPVVAVNLVTIDKGFDTELVVEAKVGYTGDDLASTFAVGFGGILYRKCGWPWGYQNITVDYDHGFGAYEGEQLPPDLLNAALGIARSVATPVATEALGGITSETIGGYSYTRDLGASSAQVVAVAGSYSRVLDRYQVKRIPVP